jgi:hypothetical protein
MSHKFTSGHCTHKISIAQVFCDALVPNTWATISYSFSEFVTPEYLFPYPPLKPSVVDLCCGHDSGETQFVCVASRVAPLSQPVITCHNGNTHCRILFFIPKLLQYVDVVMYTLTWPPSSVAALLSHWSYPAWEPVVNFQNPVFWWQRYVVWNLLCRKEKKIQQKKTCYAVFLLSLVHHYHWIPSE